MSEAMKVEESPAGLRSDGNRTALLVYPEFPMESYWNFREMHRILLGENRWGYPKAMMPPLGLLCIIGPIRERYGRENVRFIDMNVRPLTDMDLEWADDLYLSAMLTQSESFDTVARRARAMGKRVIGGGPYVNETTPNLDHAFINECETTLGTFLDEFFEGGASKVYQGHKPEAGEFLIPDYSDLDFRDYSSMAVQFSRGCPHDCEFCDITSRYGRKMRTRDSGEFLTDLDKLYDLGWRGQLFIIDDNFIGKPKDALTLLKGLAHWQKEHGYPFELFTQATVLLAEKRNEELLKAFDPAGFSMVFLGIESPSEESLRETNKLHNLKPGMTLVEKIHRIQEVGKLLILGGFILGFDSDGSDIFQRQVDFIEEIRIPTPMFALLSPLPETKLMERLEREGRLFGKASGAVATAIEVAFQPRNLGLDELIDGYCQVLRDVYLNMDGFYARCLSSLRHVQASRFPFKLDEFFGMFRLFRHEGLSSSHRGKFWKYVLTALFRHPTKLPFALRWAAYGMHYRLLTLKLLAKSKQPAPALVSAEA